jgi:hypothetical protein
MQLSKIFNDKVARSSKNTFSRSKLPLIALCVGLLLILLIKMPTASAQSTTSSNSINFAAAACGGTTTAAGSIIPLYSIFGTSSTAPQSMLSIAILIMAVMLMVASLLYMIGYIFNLSMLKNLVKAEIGEIVITGIIVAIFLGSFNAAGAVSGTTTFLHVAGTSFGRNMYVSDCQYLANTSVDMLTPLFVINVFEVGLNILSSLQFNLTPLYFGVTFSPFIGYMLFTNILGILTDIAFFFMVIIFGTLVLLGFIYSLFPLFLYAGIVLRTLPWTRAAGGAFLGFFVGFYIVFPLLLHIVLFNYLSGFLPVNQVNIIPDFTCATASTTTTTSNCIFPTLFPTFSSKFDAAQYANKAIALFQSLYSCPTDSGIAVIPSCGLINGFIYFVIEPTAFVILGIVLSLMISIDFAELVGDLLGAPSLTGGKAFDKILK